MGSETTRHVAVVLVCLGGREDTIACLGSLRELRWSGRLSIVLVDNGSTDGTPEAVESAFPEVDVLRSPENLGYAGGNNLGIRHALAQGADDVLILNNDTHVDPGALEALVAERDARPHAGALSPLILYEDPPDVIWYGGKRFDPRRGHQGRHLHEGERDRGQVAAVTETGCASGCAMLVPREVLEDVGLFDEQLFLYCEDTDLSLRMRAAGRRIYVVPSARVIHKVSATSGGAHSPTIAYYGARNRLEVCRRHAPLGPVRHAVRTTELLVAQLVHTRRAERPLENARAVLAGWRDYRNGRLGPRGAPVRRSPQRAERRLGSA